MSNILVWITIGFLIVALLTIVGYYREFQMSHNRVAVESFDSVKAEPQGVEERMLAPVTGMEKLVESPNLVAQTETEANENWSKMTSERCFKRDMAEQLKLTGNYLQRTNNYQHTYPDSCSAPNHEFVGTFYRPHEGIGSTPKTGMPLPASTQCV